MLCLAARAHLLEAVRAGEEVLPRAFGRHALEAHTGHAWDRIKAWIRVRLHQLLRAPFKHGTFSREYVTLVTLIAAWNLLVIA